MSIEAMKLALEALEEVNTLSVGPLAICLPGEIDTAMDALRAAIEQAEKQEPVAWANRVIGGRKWLSIHASKGASDKWLEYRIKEQSQGEEYEQIQLYTSTPPRQPLTDEQIKDVFGVGYVAKEFVEFVRAIEAAHGIKEKS